MIKTKSLEQSASKWTDNGSRAAGAYAVGASAAAEDWASNTAAAAGNYKAGISSPNIENRFRNGVRRAGAQKYARKIASVAADRYGPGIHAGTDDWREGFQPYHATISALTLSPRKPRGDVTNWNRSMEVGRALNAKRLALLGASGGGG